MEILRKECKSWRIESASSAHLFVDRAGRTRVIGPNGDFPGWNLRRIGREGGLQQKKGYELLLALQNRDGDAGRRKERAVTIAPG